MRILYVVSHSPGGTEYGTQLRVQNIGRLLQKLGDVELLFLKEDSIKSGGLKEAEAQFGKIQVIRARDRRRSGPLNRFRHELDPSFLGTHPSEISDQDRTILMDRVAQADLVWVHTIRTANVAGIERWPRSVLDIDDLPSAHYRLATPGPNVVRNLLDRRMTTVWRRRERYLRNRFDILSVCSSLDKAELGNHDYIHVVRNGFELNGETRERKRVDPGKPPLRLGFIGTFNWKPNEDGIRWFIQSVWGRIKQEVPQAELRLVGSGSEQGFAELGPDIHGLGFIPNPDSEIQSWSGLVVPIQVGAGTRIKISEGFAREVPIVSTSIGAYGYDVVHESDLLLADNPEDFAASCARLLTDKDLAARLVGNARKRYLSEWTWEAQMPSVRAAVEHCLQRSLPVPASI